MTDRIRDEDLASLIAWAETSNDLVLRALLELRELRDYENIHGSWPLRDRRRAFVEGAKWLEYQKEGGTMWSSDVIEAEKEAEERYSE